MPPLARRRPRAGPVSAAAAVAWRVARREPRGIEPRPHRGSRGACRGSRGACRVAWHRASAAPPGRAAPAEPRGIRASAAPPGRAARFPVVLTARVLCGGAVRERPLLSAFEARTRLNLANCGSGSSRHRLSARKRGGFARIPAARPHNTRPEGKTWRFAGLRPGSAPAPPRLRPGSAPAPPGSAPVPPRFRPGSARLRPAPPRHRGSREAAPGW
jgi:hypothetical protein